MDENPSAPITAKKPRKASNVKIEAISSSKTPAQKSRLTGRLAGLMNLPLDVFAEICCYLLPPDILNLSWASKRLRSIMMSKASRQIWRTASENVLPPMPPCPSDLSEPQYVALLFTTICQICGSKRGHRVHFGLRTRHCVGCYFTELGVTTTVLQLHLTAEPAAKCALQIMPGEISLEKNRVREGNVYNLRDVQNFITEYGNLQDQDAVAKFVETRRAHFQELRLHGQKLSRWFDELTETKKREEEAIIDTRWKIIEQKLQELGWAENDYPSSDDIYSDSHPNDYSEGWLKLTRKRQVLTDIVWQNLYQKLEPILIRSRERRLRIEKDARAYKRRRSVEVQYEAYQKQKADSGIFYPNHDFLKAVTPIKELLNDDSSDMVTEAQWEACLPDLEDALRRGTKQVLDELKAWYQQLTLGQRDNDNKDEASKDRECTEITDQDFSLITAVFWCRSCQKPLWLPTVLQHQHFVCSYYRNPNDTSTSSSSELSDRYSTRFGNGPLEFLTELTPLVRNLLDRSTFDAATASVQEVVINPGEAYACGRCDESHQKPVGFADIVAHYKTEQAWEQSLTSTTPFEATGFTSHMLNAESRPDNSEDFEIEKDQFTPPCRLLDVQQSGDMKQNYEKHFNIWRKDVNVRLYKRLFQIKHRKCGNRESCSKCDYVLSGVRNKIGLMVIHLKARHGITICPEDRG